MLTSTQEDAHLAKIIEMSGASATFTWGTPPASYACSVGDIEENIAHDLDSDRVERQLPIFTRHGLVYLHPPEARKRAHLCRDECTE
jgi:hypothetical protein